MARREDNKLKELQEAYEKLDNNFSYFKEENDLEDDDNELPSTMGCLEISKVGEFITRSDALYIQKFLEDMLEEPVDVIFNVNRYSLIKTSRIKGRLRLKMNCFFASAPDEIFVAIAKMFRGDPSEKYKIKKYIEENQAQLAKLKEAAGGGGPLVTEGDFFNLELHYERVIYQARELLPAEVFENYEVGSDPKITWGRRHRRKIMSSVRLGSYSRSNNLIRVNPLLDQRWVSYIVLEHVIFHEYLHFLLPDMMSASGRRRIVHPPLFHQLEQLQPTHEEVEAWMRKNLKRLVEGNEGRNGVG